MNIGVTLFGQMITFFLFVLFTKKYVWPPLEKVLAQRQTKIADGLAAAARGHHDLELAQRAATKQIREAKQTALHIIEEAQKQAVALIEAAKEQANEEASRVFKKSQADVEQMVVHAKEGLRQQISSIALLGAEKILSRHIDAASNQDLLDKLVDAI